jgi:hypothetical protein
MLEQRASGFVFSHTSQAAYGVRSNDQLKLYLLVGSPTSEYLRPTDLSLQGIL